MSDGEKQQKNSGDSIKYRRFHVLTPEITAAVYHRLNAAACPREMQSQYLEITMRPHPVPDLSTDAGVPNSELITKSFIN